ncbi:hypothetical protein FACS1894132_05350 [Clostridia bacterium]|nr:hypothetical protein FACS1894132_05350 [Clostridia bacterium]
MITCCGDDSRDDFLQEFLVYFDADIVDSIYEHGEMKNVVLINSNTVFTSTDDTVIIYTDLIPLGYVLEFPKNYFNSHSVIFGTPCDKLLMFNQFPYRKRNLIIELARMLKDAKTIDSEVVLVKTHRRFSATDILTFDDTLNIALTDYAKIADRTSLYSFGDDKTSLFWIKASLKKNLCHQYIAALDECMSKFNAEFDVKFAASLGLRLKANESILNTEFDIEPFVLKESEKLYVYFLNDIMLWDNKFDDFLKDLKTHFAGDYKSIELQKYLREEINERLMVVLNSINVGG